MFSSNFEKFVKTTKRRSFEEVELARHKKGKHNKQSRGYRTNWEESK